MKKTKFFVSLVLALAMLVGIVAVVACNGNQHEHTYDTQTWVSVDNEYHWHPATCGDTEEGSEKTPHELDRNLKCRICGYQHVHTYEEAWSADNKEGHYHKSNCGHDLKTELEPHTFNDKFTCTVCGYVLEEAGIQIEKTKIEYTLSPATPKAKIKTDDVKVYKIMDNGDKGDEIPASDYEVKLYRGSTLLNINTSVAAGDYNLWISVKSKPELESFVLVHVLDKLTGIELQDKAEGSLFSQKRHRKDLISDTWKFTATYESGNKKTVTVEDGVLIKDFNTTVEGNNYIAKAVYTETNYKNEKQTQETVVPYNITHTDFVASYDEVMGDLFGPATINTDTDTVVKEWNGGKITATATKDKGMATAGAGAYTDLKNPLNSRSFDKCLDVGGIGNNEERSVKIELNPLLHENEVAVIIIYIRSRATDSKWVGFYDGTFKDKDSTPDARIGELVEAPSKAENIAKHELEISYEDLIDGGTFYIACETGAFYLYGIEIAYCETN